MTTKQEIAVQLLKNLGYTIADEFKPEYIVAVDNHYLSTMNLQNHKDAIDNNDPESLVYDVALINWLLGDRVFDNTCWGYYTDTDGNVHLFIKTPKQPFWCHTSVFKYGALSASPDNMILVNRDWRFAEMCLSLHKSLSQYLADWDVTKYIGDARKCTDSMSVHSFLYEQMLELEVTLAMQLPKCEEFKEWCSTHNIKEVTVNDDTEDVLGIVKKFLDEVTGGK